MSLIKDKTIFRIWITVQQMLDGYIAEYRRWLLWRTATNWFVEVK